MPSRNTKPLSWEAVHKGRIYCSSACGLGCTKQEYDRARLNARKLRDRMGKGWRIRVWENLGWHYSVISPCERIKLHPSYIAFLGEPGSSGGRYSYQHNNPEKAVLGVIRMAKQDLDQIGAIIDGL